MLRPLGDRLLVKPEPPEAITASGLHLVRHWPQETTGTVIALGTQLSPFRREAHDLARRLENFNVYHEPLLQDAATLLRDLTPTPPIAVGDFVVFSADAGQQITVDGEVVLMLRVADVLCVVDMEEVA